MYSGLLGEKIEYSLSPKIHNEKYNKEGIPLNYKMFDISSDKLEKFIIMAQKELVGFNVTIPYKEEIIKYLDEIKYPANKIGAVNTVVNSKGKLIGYNTDYFGFITSLKENNVDLEGKRALVIGSGGAAKSIIYALKDLKVTNIHVALRNEKAIQEHIRYIDKVFKIDQCFDLTDYDIVINCTPLSGANYLDKSPIEIIKCGKDTLFYDLNYSPNKTLFMKKGESYGCKSINGYSMLLNQAYKAIEIWKEVIKEDK